MGKVARTLLKGKLAIQSLIFKDIGFTDIYSSRKRVGGGEKSRQQDLPEEDIAGTKQDAAFSKITSWCIWGWSLGDCCVDYKSVKYICHSGWG